MHVLTLPAPRTKDGTVSSVWRYHALQTPTTTAPIVYTLLKRCVRYGRFGMECSVYMSLVLVLQTLSGMVQCVFLWGVCVHWAFTGMEWCVGHSLNYVLLLQYGLIMVVECWIHVHMGHTNEVGSAIRTILARMDRAGIPHWLIVYVRKVLNGMGNVV